MSQSTDHSLTEIHPLEVGFHPLIKAWFEDRHGSPTDVQRRCWPFIAAGEHVLATAPTGSGKTLSAFLWALDRLLAGAWAPGAVRVVYVSPLKALNNDIRRNLLQPLAELERGFSAAGVPCQPVNVATRSGDTPPAERRRMLREPPEILVTTPESLNILLSSASGRGMLGGVRTLILDEIHALAGNRRGVWLASAVERLSGLAGEFQRIGLSATIRPLDAIAELLGGYARAADGAPAGTPRPVRVVESSDRQRLELRVEALEPDRLPEDGGLDALGPIARSIQSRSRVNRSTLVFCNSRQLSEKLAARVNDGAGETLAWAHHGSLSREIRVEVEQRLKAGRLRTLIATSSLEMGIDIGDLDEVVLVQSPPGVASTIQRAGRAGHGVGQTSRAVLHPTHPHDLLEGTVAVHCALAGDIEPLRLPRGCLDVLAQIVLASLLPGPLPPDVLFDQVRCAAPYRNLSRAAFDAVVDMLCGHYAGSRIRELRPRLTRHPDTGALHATRGAALALYAAGGMIPDRGYFKLRHAGSQARIGELDEEFVWENGPGRAFTLGSQQWRVQRVTHNDVFVLPAPDAVNAPPFWRSEERDRDSHLSLRIGAFLDDCDQTLAAGQDPLDGHPAATSLDGPSRQRLGAYLARQRAHTGTALPHGRHLLLERVAAAVGGTRSDAGQLILHTSAGARINRPWALALEAAWQQHFGERPDIYPGNDAVVIQLAADVDADTVLSLVSATSLHALLHQRLAGSGFFGARFRECAGRALLLPRGRMGERQPLWLSRLHSQRLLGRLGACPDFPVVLEAWRSCLEDAFDLPGLRRLLTRLEAGEIRVSSCRTATASPFAAGLSRQQISQYMYADDTPRTAGGSHPPTLLETVLGNAALRPRVSARTVERFIRRRRRLEAGWQPADALELADWIGERRFLAAAEFAEVSASLAAEEVMAAEAWLVRVHGRGQSWVVRRTDAPTLLALAPGLTADGSTAAADGAPSLTEWVADWLGAQPPLPEAALAEAWPGPSAALLGALAELEEAGRVLRGPLLAEDEQTRLSDTHNFEAMLRLERAARRHLDPLAAGQVGEFILDWQRVGLATDMLDALEPLRGLALPAERWEGFVLPARLGKPAPLALDQVLAGGELVLFGAGAGRLGFALREELPLLPSPAVDTADRPGDPLIDALLPSPLARLPFASLVEACGGDGKAAATRLWSGVWEGQLTLDSFEPVRRGLAWQFRLPALEQGTAGASQPGRRSRLRQRLQARVAGYPGCFTRLHRGPCGPHEPGGLDELEHARDRARLLLDRWGVLCPELLQREAPGMTWRSMFRALRLLELSGEVIGGLFLEGLSGPQFALPEAVEQIRAWVPDSGPVRWLHAQDPASPCGLGPAPAGLPLPAARSGSELVFGGGRVLLTWTRGSGSLALDGPPGSASFSAAARSFATALAWRPPPRHRIEVTAINGEPARSSPCLSALEAYFDISAGHRTVSLTPLPEYAS